jgi:hypothetical protein
MRRWGYRRASLPACQELARTRPWINDSTYSWFTAYSIKSQAVSLTSATWYLRTKSTQVSAGRWQRCASKTEVAKRSSFSRMHKCIGSTNLALDTVTRPRRRVWFDLATGLDSVDLRKIPLVRNGWSVERLKLSTKRGIQYQNKK